MYSLRIALAMMALCLVSLAQAAPLSDSAARKLIDDYLNGMSVGVFYGTYLVEEPPDFANGRIGIRSYHYIRAAEALGWMSVRSLPKATGPLGVPLTPPHVFSERIVATLTDRGRELMVDKKAAFLLQIPLGKFAVQKTVRNEEIKRGADDYRLLFAAYSADWNANYLVLLGAALKIKNVFEGKCAGCESGPRVGNRRKARLLLKYDDFKSSWSVVAHDLADEEDAFVTDNVNNLLK